MADERKVLAHSAEQIDDGLNIARNVSNPNLLDNWYFGNPVDQRQGRVVKPNTTYYSDNTLATAAGTTSAYVTAYRYATGTANGVNYVSFKLEDKDTAPTYYAAPENVVRGYTGAGYGIDRWYGEGILIEPNGITLTDAGKYIFQNLDDELKKALDGKTVTVSALLSTGELLFGTKVYAAAPSAGEYFVAGTLHIVNNTNGGIMFWANQKATIVAVKLELGSQQTLAHQENGSWVLNEIPDYGEQLARCQRQAEKSCNMGTSVGSPETASPIIKVAYSKWGFCEPMVFFKVPKRAIPAVKIFSAKTGAEGMAYDETAMQDVAVTPSYVGQNSFTVQHASENLVTGHAYQFYYFATAEL